jgi:hypothetical protein
MRDTTQTEYDASDSSYVANPFFFTCKLVDKFHNIHKSHACQMSENNPDNLSTHEKVSLYLPVHTWLENNGCASKPASILRLGEVLSPPASRCSACVHPRQVTSRFRADVLTSNFLRYSCRTMVFTSNL